MLFIFLVLLAFLFLKSEPSSPLGETPTQRLGGPRTEKVACLAFFLRMDIRVAFALQAIMNPKDHNTPYLTTFSHTFISYEIKSSCLWHATINAFLMITPKMIMPKHGLLFFFFSSSTVL